MPLIETSSSPVVLRLNRDLVRMIKRGHPWVYGDALRELPKAPAGSPAVLLDNRKGQPVARGFYDPGCPVALRICETDPDLKLDDRWAERRLKAALTLRRLFSASGQTTGFRLFNGEGDGLPGLVADVYADTAVVKLDGDWFLAGERDCSMDRPRTEIELRLRTTERTWSNGTATIWLGTCSAGNV